MKYFNEDKTASESEELYSRLANICLEQLMFSSDAYVCMIKLNLHGYKRLHRVLTKKFYDLYLELQNDIVEMYHKVLPVDEDFKHYTTESLKEHLHNWNKKAKEDLVEVGEIIRKIFEQDGYIPCVAQKVQKILYKNIIKNERAIQKFEDCDWSNDVIYLHDKYLHDKIKHEEHREV